MLVTIYTDASFNPWLKTGAWAFWARSDAGRMAKSGAFKTSISNPHEAEMLCIVNALTCVRKSWPMCTAIIVNTDNKNCIDLLTGRGRSKVDRMRMAVSMVEEMKSSSGGQLRIMFRHIKGHQDKNKSVKTWLNNWCDNAAKAAAKQDKIGK